MLKKILIIIIRVIIGAVFCFSAYTKLHPVEPFEMMFVEMGLSNWELAPFIARFFISVEFLLGILMILSLIPKITAKLILFVLLFFTGYLIYILIREGNSENCGCFGLMIKMNPVESILKNIVLIGLTIVLLISKETIVWKWKFNKFLITGIVIGALASPIILNPPGFIIHYSRPPEKTGYKFNIDEMGSFSFQDSTYHLSEGKKVVCFFSLKCRFCKLAAQKLTIIQERIKKPLPVYYILVGETKDLYKFWAESKSFQFPNMIENPEVFFKYSGNSLPAIYLLNNDIVYKKLNFDELSEKEIVSFLFDK
jgi:uncharacterized membrane protein YphA (DoxX/SURF4 family)